MSENPGNPTSSGDNVIVGPDFFGLYTSEVAHLLSQDEGLQPYSRQTSHLAGNPHEVGREKGKSKNSCRTKENNGISGSASYSNGIGALLSEFKKERLKSLLRQSVFTLSQEVDEMIDPILSLCRIRTCLRYKGRLSSLNASVCEAEQPQHTSKKLKILPPSLSPCNACGIEKNGPVLDSDIDAGKENIEIDDDLQLLLDNDSTKVEELMKKHSSEFLATLHYMEQKLEELLNIVMASCRPMTLTEKQQLRKVIQNLPARNLGRVVEIIGHNKPSEKYSSNQVHVDLDDEENVTLWRLYFYGKAVRCYDTIGQYADRRLEEA